jgi:hypothetical protein
MVAGHAVLGGTAPTRAVGPLGQGSTGSTVIDTDTVRALRHARKIVQDMHWRGMAVPPLYGSMAERFQALVGSGVYAAWVASVQKAPRQDNTHAQSRRASRSAVPVTTPTG